MLNVMRQKAGSWVVKVLLLLLVVSFAIWGIGDVFFGGAQNPTVATVGNSEISAGELADAFNRSLNNLQQRLGSTIDREQAIQFGLMQQALQDLIARRLIDLRARDMGLTMADDTLRQLVTDDPVFQSAGRFDRDRFEQLLRANGMTEQGYLASLRQDVVRSTLTSSLAGPVAVPATLVDAIYRYRNEERRGHYVAIEASSITDLPQPSEDDLAAFHKAHEAEYTTPEYRRLTFITLAAEDLIDEVDVSEAEIEAEYQARIETYRTPERRTVEQLLAPDGAAIEKAAQQVAEGASFDEVAETLSAEGVSADDLGQVTTADLPPGPGEAIFALAEGEVSRLVESPFGWHLFKVTEILPEEVVPLAEAHDEIARELALAEASERLPNFATQLDDELAAGLSLSEAAAAVGLEAKSVAGVDAQGNDPEGQRPADLPDWPEFLTLAFETPAGEASLLEETEAGGYFVLQVDEIVPPMVKPVDEVRSQLLEAWQAEKRRELARQRAEDLLAQLQDGASLDELAVAQNLTVTPIEPVTRGETGADQGINQAVVRALFATAPGRPADQVIALGDSFAVVATDEVIGVDPAADQGGVERLEAELEADMQNDLLAQFESQLRRDYPVEIDGAAINRVIGADGLLQTGGGTRAMPGPTAPF
jgi:peptidyl-prolyl cis-trans isomerase D